MLRNCDWRDGFEGDYRGPGFLIYVSSFSMFVLRDEIGDQNQGRKCSKSHASRDEVKYPRAIFGRNVSGLLPKKGCNRSRVSPIHVLFV